MKSEAGHSMKNSSQKRRLRKTQQRHARREVDGILLLDKPAGLTSNAALQCVKRLYRADKAGHTGSLDPLATGLLPICLGEATKLSALLLEDDKVYHARVRLGVATNTGDSEGEPVRYSDAAKVERAALEAAIPGFIGAQMQVPPMHSAIKRDGKKLYKLARAGIEVEREARPIVIHALKLLDFAGPEFSFEVRCSKGTYVRTLAEDWCAAIGQAGHLTALRRIALGPFEDVRMCTLDELEFLAAGNAAGLDAALLSPLAAVRHWPRVTADAAQALALAQGLTRIMDSAPAAGRVAVVDSAGALLGLAEIDAFGRVAPRRWLVHVNEPRVGRGPGDKSTKPGRRLESEGVSPYNPALDQISNEHLEP